MTKAALPTSSDEPSEEPSDNAAAKLVGKVLNSQQPKVVSHQLATPSPDPELDQTNQAAQLIELYFELELPQERDALLLELSRNSSPQVAEFFSAVLFEDEDPVIRSTAAAELARLGSSLGIEALMSDLKDPIEQYFFDHALTVLSLILGPAFYDTLTVLWQDPNRDAAERCSAMRALENVDKTRALEDYAEFIAGPLDLATLDEDQLETALLAFASHNYQAAGPKIEALRQTIATSSLSTDEQVELISIIDSGLRLLKETV